MLLSNPLSYSKYFCVVFMKRVLLTLATFAVSIFAASEIEVNRFSLWP